jgi:hypothetical protein
MKYIALFIKPMTAFLQRYVTALYRLLEGVKRL